MIGQELQSSSGTEQNDKSSLRYKNSSEDWSSQLDVQSLHSKISCVLPSPAAKHNVYVDVDMFQFC